jgi:DNA-binding MarR family transcriptional regulator
LDESKQKFLRNQKQDMEIEKEIKTAKFAHEYHKLAINLIYSSNWLTRFLEKRASKEGITLHQFNVLRILRGQYPAPCNNAMIKSRMLDKKSDVSRIVDRLVMKNLIHRSKSDQDGRSVCLTITKEGLNTLQNLEHSMMLEDLLPKNLSEAECKQLNALLDKLRG